MRYPRFAMCVVGLIGWLAAAQSPSVQQPDVPGFAITDGRQFALTVIRSQCIEFTEVKRGAEPSDIRNCRVSEFGEFGSVDGQTYYYATYCLIPNYATDKGECGDESFSGRYYRQRGLAIFVRDPSSENAQLLFERVSGEVGVFVYLEKPEIIQASAGTILYLPIGVDGTGHGNASEYYLRRARQWERIEAESWLANLQKQIPSGLEMWKGVWPDLHTMRAETALYRPGDANCCPSGGSARVRLAIRSRQLVIDSVVIEKAQ